MCLYGLVWDGYQSLDLARSVWDLRRQDSRGRRCVIYDSEEALRRARTGCLRNEQKAEIMSTR